MEVLTLDRAKEILRMEKDYTEEDAHLSLLCKQAVSLFQKMALCNVNDIAEGGEIPPSTMATIEFIFVYLYQNGTSGEDINRLLGVIKSLVQLDRNYL